MGILKVTFSQIIGLWQTDQMQKRNFHLSFWRFGLSKAKKSSISILLSNFQAKNPKKQEEILKKISESCVFASGLFVRALWSEKKWPLQSSKLTFQHLIIVTLFKYWKVSLDVSDGWYSSIWSLSVWPSMPVTMSNWVS